MLALIGITFFNLIIFIHITIKRRKKDRQNDQDISMLRRNVAFQEKLINGNATDLKLKINEKGFELLKLIENQENKVKASFDKAASHANSISKKLSETSEELSLEIKSIRNLLQELKEESSSKAEGHDKIIGDLEKKIETVISDYKELRWQVKNLTEIEEDSKRLNENIDESQQEALIEAIVSKINANRESHKTEEKHGDLTKIVDENTSEDSFESSDEVDETAEVLRDEMSSSGDKIYNKNGLKQQNTSIKPESAEDTASKQIFYGNGISLDEEQAKALDCMENTNGNYFITGKAGTGKSFLLRIFQSLTKKIILRVAPTGIAALNIDGVTIHSAFGFKNLSNQNIETLNKDTLSLSSDKALVLKNMDVLIIDEISMVRADIFDKMDKILRIVCQKEDLPFGGKQVLVFGDLFQLPPIADRNEEKYLKDKYGGIFFFNSDSYKNSNFSYIELRTNHRQKGDQKFFEILNKIREGTMTDADIDLVNERYSKNNDDLRRIIRLYPKRSLADRVNEDELNKIWGNERVYNAQVTYSKYTDLVKSYENNFQISAALRLKIGAMVMMTRNDPERRWVNGTLGIINKLGENTIFVQINGYTYEIGRSEFEMSEAVYENGKIMYNPIFKVKQFPMMLAYAITIHKSQGSTYQQIACDPSDCFAPGQAYVALSRCVDLKGIHLLKKLGSADIKVDSQIREFYLNNNK